MPLCIPAGSQGPATRRRPAANAVSLAKLPRSIPEFISPANAADTALSFMPLINTSHQTSNELQTSSMSAGVNNDMRLSQTIRTEDATAETLFHSQRWRRRSRSPPPTIADAREPPGHAPGGFPRRTVGACHAHLTFNTPRRFWSERRPARSIPEFCSPPNATEMRLNLFAPIMISATRCFKSV
jgi:hypothetical protein